MCLTDIDREAHDRGICYDCYCKLDLQAYEEHLKKNDCHNSEGEQVRILPTSPHLGDFVTAVGLMTAGVFYDLLWRYFDNAITI